MLLLTVCKTRNMNPDLSLFNTRHCITVKVMAPSEEEEESASVTLPWLSCITGQFNTQNVMNTADDYLTRKSETYINLRNLLLSPSSPRFSVQFLIKCLFIP